MTAEQRSVARRMAIGVAITIVALSAAFALRVGPALPPPDRLAVALRIDLILALWLAFAIGNVARRRFLSPADIAGSGAGPPSDRLAPASAFLQNTLEQVVLAIPVHAALALTLPRPLPVIATLVALFSIGRWLFAAGYARGAGARALGFALTFYPTVAALLVALYRSLF